MEITLTKPDVQRFIEEQVKTGRFSSPAEVVEAGIARLMKDEGEEPLDEETLAAIRRAAAQLARGEGREFSQVAAEFRRKYVR